MDKYNLYIKAFSNALIEFGDDEGKGTATTTAIKRLALYGVKAINSSIKEDRILRSDIESRFEFISIVKNIMSLLTPAEFMNAFPVMKDYKGHKYGMKDYFYTRDYINTLEHDKPIGSNILEFLWRYQNKEVLSFTLESVSCISELRRLQGYPSLAEEFAGEMGMKTYKMYTDDKGQDYLLDKETGRTRKCMEKRHLHLVK